jgi:hypothetical protein
LSDRIVRPPNSLLLIGDPAGEPPKSMSGKGVAATTSLVAVGTLYEGDGTTSVRIVGNADVGHTLPPLLAFEGTLVLPSSILAITNVNGERYVERPVLTPSTRVQVWVNHSSDPDEICVVVLD